MTVLELKWIANHPLRWLKAAWFHWSVGILLLIKGALITDPLWEVTALAHLWPIALGAAAAMCIASSIAITDQRLQRATMISLFAVSIWRIFTYALVLIASDSHTTQIIAFALTLNWALLAVTATRWPIISTHAALLVTVDSGRDAGRLRATG